MSTNATVASAVLPARSRESGHHARLVAAYVIAIALILGIFGYGLDYYTASSAERPFSPKHALLRPSGHIGINLGILGLVMFVVIFLYPLRKRWPWLARQGSTKRWLDFHVLLGLSAPFVIALHSSFKFRGIAGVAFWIMLAVSLSGVVGRYLYGQIPRQLNAAEMSRKELQDLQQDFTRRLSEEKMLPEENLREALKLPSQAQVDKLPVLVALVYMFALDLARPLRIARLRRHALTLGERTASLGGLLASQHADLERAITTVREEAALAKRILFLTRSQQVFHLWHVIHKPFSYTFAVLALGHVVVVFLMGYL